MPESMSEARGVMSEAVLEAWNTICNTIYGATRPVRWSSLPNSYDDLPARTTAWARVTIKHIHNAQTQSSLSAANSLIKWQRSGTLTVQCFAPLSEANAYGRAEQMACYIRDVLQRYQSCIRFRRCEAIEIGIDDGWFVFNVNVTFQYDELK